MADATGGITDLAWISALYALGHKAANGANPRQVQQEILEHIVRGFDAESGSIALIVKVLTINLKSRPALICPAAPSVTSSRVALAYSVMWWRQASLFSSTATLPKRDCPFARTKRATGQRIRRCAGRSACRNARLAPWPS